MRLVATPANECRSVVIGTYCHKSACIATNDFLAIDLKPCSVSTVMDNLGIDDKIIENLNLN